MIFSYRFTIVCVRQAVCRGSAVKSSVSSEGRIPLGWQVVNFVPNRHQTSRQVIEAGGYAEVLRVAVPLIVSTASRTIALFVARMFLSWYGQPSVAAAMPGRITYFTVCSLLPGVAQYVNTVVAQHHAAGDKPACARAVWLGVLFAALPAPLILASIPLGAVLWLLFQSRHWETMHMVSQDGRGAGQYD